MRQEALLHSENSGFTLIEVLIVVAILATLTLLSGQSIQQALRSKVKIQKQIDEVSQVRDALKILERDINLAYHYRDFEMEMAKLVQSKGRATTTTLPNTPPIPPDPNDPLNRPKPDRVDPTTHFVGKSDSIYFATMNASRISSENAQADFVKVGYYLENCRKPGSDLPSTQCLIRRESILVEGDVTKGGKPVVLLNGIKEFALRYLGEGKQDWVEDWSTVQGDGATKDRFPEAVEVSLAVEKVSMQLVIPVRFPNNAPRGNPNAPPAPGGPFQ